MNHERTPGSDDGEQLPPMELSEQSLVKTDQYQSLFLTNGQVYFGNLWVYSSGYLLSDIYYLQVVKDEKGEAVKEENGSDKMTLIKLGNEIHGPEDAQFFALQAVQSWQNLRDDGRVAEAINQYKENGPSEPTVD